MAASPSNRAESALSRRRKAAPSTPRASAAGRPTFGTRGGGGSSPPRDGEGDHPQGGGGGSPQARRKSRAPSTALRAVPLPILGRILTDPVDLFVAQAARDDEQRAGELPRAGGEVGYQRARVALRRGAEHQRRHFGVLGQVLVDHALAVA